MKIKPSYQIAIIGAGPAGCSCAIALQKLGISDIIILDNSKIGKFQIGESVPPDINSIFKQLDIFESFLKENHEPCYGSCSYWGSELRGYNDSILSPFGHGWHLDRSKFNQFMIVEAKKTGSKILTNSTYETSYKKNEGYQIKVNTKDGETKIINANFVIDASGSKGVFASQNNSEKINDRHLVCLGMQFKNSGTKEISKLTHLESVENGWWYAARIPNNKLLVTFYTIPEIVKNKNLQNTNNWLKLLKKATNTSNWIADMEVSDKKIQGYYAPTFCLSQITGENWLTIGDAASSYDPITSQGIIKSMIQGIRAAEIIKHYNNGNEDALNHFEKEIKEQYNTYSTSRTYFYNLEQRWVQSPFWKVMQENKQQITSLKF